MANHALRLASGGACLRLAAAGACLAMLGGCAAVIDQATFFPQQTQAPAGTLAVPAGYVATDAMFDLPGVGAIHAVRLDNPASEATMIYSGGNGNFVSASSADAAALAAASGMDLILYDYPGRGGTTVPPTIDASLATGPLFLDAMRSRGWIGAGPLFAYGLSFGGSQAAAMARGGGFAGLILEGTASDIAAVGRNFVPALAKPFVRLRVDPALERFDYLGYAVAAKAPILLIASQDDQIVRLRNMRDFESQLRARGAAVTLVSVPGAHGTGTEQPAAMAALRDFVQAPR